MSESAETASRVEPEGRDVDPYELSPEELAEEVAERFDGHPLGELAKQVRQNMEDNC